MREEADDEEITLTPERISKNAAYGLLARTALYAAGYALHWDLNTYDKSTANISVAPSSLA